MSQLNLIDVGVPMLDEGTQASRRTTAIQLGDNLYKLLVADNYNPEDETWEFPPGSIVRCEVEIIGNTNETYLLAVEMQQPDGSFVRSTIFPKE